MKKKIVSTIVATLVCAACVMGVVGLTACGGLSLPKGVELADEAAWEAAFEKTVEAKNATAKVSGKVSAKSTMEVAGQKTTLSTTMTEEASCYIGDTEAYVKAAATSKVSGNGESATVKQQEEGYFVVDGETLWNCEYATGTEIENAEWEVQPEDAAELNDYKENLLTYVVFSYRFSTTESGYGSELVDLYDAFEYENGYYKATLYVNGITGTLKADVKVSFNKDGYVLGYTVKASMNEDVQGVKVSGEMNVTCVLSNFGSTKVSAPSGAKKAIEAAKA